MLLASAPFDLKCSLVYYADRATANNIKLAEPMCWPKYVQRDTLLVDSLVQILPDVLQCFFVEALKGSKI